MLEKTVESLKNYELWSYLGWVDVSQRYKRSAIGPFWLTINNAIIVLLLSIVWSTIFKVTLSQFLPYFAISNICWIYISTVISESAVVITSSESLVKQIRIPIETLFMRMLWKNFVIFLHFLPIPLVVFLFFPESYKGDWLSVPTALFGVLLVSIFLYFLTILLGLICTRFRDVAQLVGSALQMAFLATPILWQKSALGARTYLYEINPFYHLLEVIRAPLLEGVYPYTSMLVVIGASSVLAVMTHFAQKKFSKSVVYWI